MSIEKFKPGPTCSPLFEYGKVVGHISFGGEMLLMPVGSKTVLFELHGYLGPIPCNKKSQNPLDNVPTGFFDAYERWEVGGQLVDGTTCIVRQWCKSCDGSGDEKRQIVGRIFEIVGKCKSCGGSRLAAESES